MVEKKFMGAIAPSVKINPEAYKYTFLAPFKDGTLDYMEKIIKEMKDKGIRGDWQRDFYFGGNNPRIEVFTSIELEGYDKREKALPKFNSIQEKDMYTISCYPGVFHLESDSHFTPSEIGDNILTSAPIDQDLEYKKVVEIYPDDSWTIKESGVPTERGAIRAYYLGSENITRRPFQYGTVPGWS